MGISFLYINKTHLKDVQSAFPNEFLIDKFHFTKALTIIIIIICIYVFFYKFQAALQLSYGSGHFHMDYSTGLAVVDYDRKTRDIRVSVKKEYIM